MFKPFRSAAVLGAGVMGTQIAAHLANAGLTVYLLDLAAPGTHKSALAEGAFKKAQQQKPPILFTPETARRVHCGNYDSDWGQLSQVDWVIEAVVEDLDIKQAIMARVAEVVLPETVISSNTSGLRLGAIAADLPKTIQQRFLGTHFFNPVRYLKLLELIPLPETDQAVIERLQWFAQLHLGKGVVIAKDTPNFIANRIGLLTTFTGIRAVSEGGYTIEAVDTLTGELVGRPKSATFRTADLVGLDTLVRVADNLYPAIPEDERRNIFQVPELLRQLVSGGALGAKAGQGFYKKVGGSILSVNPRTLVYQPAAALDLPGIESLSQLALPERLQALYALPGRAGDLFRQLTLDLLSYSACRLPEIADSPADVDRAMRWGFGWQLGPFEIWDVLGFHQVLYDLQAKDYGIPSWVNEMSAVGEGHFYHSPDRVPAHLLSAQTVIGPAGEIAVEQPADQIELSTLKTRPQRQLWQNAEAALIDLGEGVVLYEFRSKGNTLSTSVVNGLSQVLDLLDHNSYRGLVIGNDSAHFSGGANLAEMAAAAQAGPNGLAPLLNQFQTLMQRLHYYHKPIVAAVQGRALGGGCELIMACPHVVAAAESYIGLVELSVGLIPGAGGVMRLVQWASEQAASDDPQQIFPFLFKAFKTLGTATVAGSAAEAQALGFLPVCTHVVMDGDRRLAVAKAEVLRLDREGYRPPMPPTRLWALGQPTYAKLLHAAQVMAQGHYISAYDRFLAERLAYVMTGGGLSGPTRVSQADLLRLERETFLPLLQRPETQARIAHMLKYKKPLRN
ncbi:MAG: 3-hydroxyacyl-CoA dehydrogenase NAD-binding domain-containing protein [Cyanobacteria bacterium J06626_23]